MASDSKSAKGKESHEHQLVSNEVKQPKFKPIPEVAYKNDPIGALSVIPDKVVMVQDVRNYYNWKIGAIGDLEIVGEQICSSSNPLLICPIWLRRTIAHNSWETVSENS